MASRAMREGAVGLMIVGGIGLFLALVGWLRDVQLGRSSYQIVVEFIDARGIQAGTPVNYRGVQVGKVRSITPTSQLVDVVIDISRLDVLIPHRTRIEAQSSALLGETALDLQPLAAVPERDEVAGPLDKDCDAELILCDGSRLAGSTVADLTDLIRSMNELAAVLNNPQVLQTIETTAESVVMATTGITEVTENLSGLSSSLQGEVGNLSTTLRTAQRAVNTAGQAAVSVDTTAKQLGGVVVQAGALADQTGGLVAQTGGLVDQASAVLEQNRDALNRALVNVGEAGNAVQGSLGSLQPLIQDLSSRRDLVENLDQLTQNTRVMTANLRNASEALNDPQTLLLLQQTLDAARVTFQNAQKLTADLDEVTGDPQFRLNLRQLVNGLSSLVSSTQVLEQQVAVAQSLSPHSSPRQVQQLAQLNTQVNMASLGLMRDLAELNQSLEQAAAADRASGGSPAQSEQQADTPQPRKPLRFPLPKLRRE